MILKNNPLYVKVLADPRNLDNRLVLADALEEVGDPLGTFIRSQIGLNSGKLDKPQRRQATKFIYEFLRNQAPQLLPEQDEQNWGHRGLSSKPYQLGFLQSHFAKRQDPNKFWHFENGLPDTLEISAKTLLEEHDELFSNYPIYRLEIFDLVSNEYFRQRKKREFNYEWSEEWGRLDNVLELEQLHQLESLTLYENDLLLGDVDRLVQCEQLKNLKCLRVRIEQRYLKEAIERICNSKIFSKLESLAINYKPLFESPFREYQITDDLLEKIANAPGLPSLQFMEVRAESMYPKDRISERGVNAILDTGRIRGITLCSGEINDPFYQAIAAHPNSRLLEYIKFAWAKFSRESIGKFARSDNLGHLKHLDLSFTLGEGVADLMDFGEGENLRSLETLEISCDQLTNKTLQAINRGLPSLKNLNFRSGFSQDASVAALNNLFRRLDHLSTILGDRSLDAVISADLLEWVPTLDTKLEGGIAKLTNVAQSKLQYLNLDFVYYDDASSEERVLAQLDSKLTSQFLASPLAKNLEVFVDGTKSPETITRKLKKEFGARYAQTS